MAARLETPLANAFVIFADGMVKLRNASMYGMVNERTKGADETMSKRYKIVYSVNSAIIVLGLLSPVIGLIIDPTTSSRFVTSWYVALCMLSMTFCVTFLGMNFYAALKLKQQRIRYYAISLVLLIWIVWGVYQLVFGLVNDISL